MKLIEGAEKIVKICAGVKPREVALVVTDKHRPTSVGQALVLALESSGADTSLLLFSGELPDGEPNKTVTAAINEADVVFCATTKSLGHSAAVANALKKGARVLTLTEATEKTLTCGAIEADFLSLQPVINYVKKRFDLAHLVHVTTLGGTDIRLNISERLASTCTGICSQSGKMMGIPDVEVYIAPLEDKTAGKLVVDASCSGIGLIREPITVTVERGIASIIGEGKEADKIQELLASTRNQYSYVIAEFAIGLNPKGTVIGSITVDEGIYGTGHFALGNNTGFGGNNKAPIHIDMVYWKPTIKLDGEFFMKDGLLCPNEEIIKCLDYFRHD